MNQSRIHLAVQVLILVFWFPGQFTTKTLKCTQSSARGVKAERVFEYERNNERVGDRIISLCAIKESIVVDGNLNLGTRRLSEIDCDWIPSCYEEATKKSGMFSNVQFLQFFCYKCANSLTIYFS